ncbi:MAG: hypothetical protein OXF02_01950 [Simkaniaceae bacterium]|nr:hypothetical protein [Simkaniaceae bacterium]
MIGKRRSFVLLELSLSLGLVVLFLFPVMRTRTLSLRAEREYLFDIEKEIKADELFYRLYRELAENAAFRNIREKRYGYPEERAVTLDIGEGGKRTLYWHYSTYSRTTSTTLRKVHCHIYITPHLGKHRKKDPKYTFTVTANTP